MTRDDLATLIEQYQAGLDAELQLLRQLEAIARRQQTVTAARDFNAFGAESEARDRLTRGLVAIEEGLGPIRRDLATHRREAETLPGFFPAIARHREASALVGRILETDRASFRALADADIARRAALTGLEQGEQTLAAYRRVLVPPSSGAALLDERG